MRFVKCIVYSAVMALFLVVQPAFAHLPMNPREEISASIASRQAHRLLLSDAFESYRKRSSFARRLSVRDRASSNPIDISYSFLQFEANETAGVIDTTSKITIKATEDNVTQAAFLYTPLDDSSVQDGEGNALETYLETGDDYSVLYVALPAALTTGQEFNIVFVNNGTPSCAPDPYFGMAFCSLSTQITYFASGAEWFPTKAADTYEDYYTSGLMDMDIVTPKDSVAVSTSDLTDIEDTGDKLVHHFVGQSATGSWAFAYAIFQSWTTEVINPPALTTWIHTGDAGYGQAWADIAGDIIEYFSGILEPYEYEKNEIIQATEELGGGFATGTATVYYASALETSPEEYYSETIFSHELGHTWWGFMYRSADLLSPWLTEGINEYHSRLYSYMYWPEYLADYLYEAYYRIYQFQIDPAAEVPITGEDIFTDDSLIYTILTYDKGAHVMRMLQWLLGDEVFFQGLKIFTANYNYSATGRFYYVDDIKEVFEVASGIDLTDFFDQWVYGTGSPTYRWAAEFGEQNGQCTARIRVEQTQEADTVFSIPIQANIWVGENEDPTPFTLSFNGRVADETFAFAEKPRGIQVDQAYWIWGDKIPALTGDIDGSNEVDGIDLIYCAWSQGGDYFSTDYSTYNYYSKCDFNRDTKTDATDMEGLLVNFGRKGTIDE
jgi:hypothetical protein